MSLAFTPRSPLSKRPTPLRVEGKLAIALRAMIHEGMSLIEASQHAAMLPVSIRAALAKPHVQQWIRAEKQVRLEHVRLDNISDLARIKKGDGAAAVTAIRALEEMAAPEAARVATNAQTLPGVTINIISNQPQSDEGERVHPMVIEHEPAIASGGLVDQPSSQAKKSSVKKAGGKNRGLVARS